MKPAYFSALTPDHISEATGLPVGRLFKLARHIEPYYRKTREEETKPGKFRIIDAAQAMAEGDSKKIASVASKIPIVP